MSVVASASTCAWTAVSTVPWVAITSGASGTGSGAVQYTVASNIGGPGRTTALDIAMQQTTIAQAGDTDVDLDTLPDAWRRLLGLDPLSGAGDNGAQGDPDADGRTNLQEHASGTHPRGFVTRYLAEGAVNLFFKTRIAVLNPGGTTARVLVRVNAENEAERSFNLQIPAATRHTINATRLASVASAPFATVVESDALLVVDRTMSWNETGYGSHADSAVVTPATAWYFAEGSTSGDFVLFYLLQNPAETTVEATVRFLRPPPLAPIDLSYSLPPRSRTTIPVDTAAADLASTDVSAIVSASRPIVVERAMYLNRPEQLFSAGHASAGVNAPALDWFLAEGATGTFFELFVLIANPQAAAAVVNVDYLLPDGNVLTKAYQAPAQSRFTIWVDEEEFPSGSGNKALAGTAVAMRVRSSNGVPIIVERSMWWPQPLWHEAHNEVGATETGTRWGLADGQLGGPGPIRPTCWWPTRLPLRVWRPLRSTSRTRARRPQPSR